MLSKDLLGGNYWIKQDQPSACLCFTSHWSHLLRTNSFHFLDGFTIAQSWSKYVTKKLTFSDIWTQSWKYVWNCFFALGTARKKALIRLFLTHSSGGIPGGAWSLAWSLGINGRMNGAAACFAAHTDQNSHSSQYLFRTIFNSEQEYQNPCRRHGTGMS